MDRIDIHIQVAGVRKEELLGKGKGASQPGMLVEYKSLANDLNKDQRTITNYFEYLEWSFLVRALYFFSSNLLTSEKKRKKYYLAHPAFCSALVDEPSDELKGRLVENLFISVLKAKFFYHSTTKEEVDKTWDLT